MKLNTRGQYPSDWGEIARNVKQLANGKCIRCDHPHDVEGGYCLTVHHFNGDKANCHWWNLLALCQRCHLHIQAKVEPEQVYMFEHSDWLKPYVAGFYGWKYEEVIYSRRQVEKHLERLLAYERIV